RKGRQSIDGCGRCLSCSECTRCPCRTTPELCQTVPGIIRFEANAHQTDGQSVSGTGGISYTAQLSREWEHYRRADYRCSPRITTIQYVETAECSCRYRHPTLAIRYYSV